ncbi:TauD/TfdA family dioxygenase [Thalassomonas actiniarum]|uniref:TauD/TfdA family dioxygenase n=1 Tax=Thalassomonas actiniarum TaxID=485447 RepID=A0AAF0C5Z3_9GAMM|nr:TauD/TfdA family dioxygenase [Thalassomonas actiniarum]WDE01651.1 TauD/TfdA family dioxygenase [Thalassomonas actiniarum]
MRSLPESAIIQVADNKAARLLSASEQMTPYSNRDYYQAQIQLDAYNCLRGSCPDEFDTLQELIKSALQHPPYSVLIKGLQFDDHYRLLVALNRSLGKLVARPFDENTPRAQLIHHVQPQTDINNQNKTTDAVAKLSEKLHIDGADRLVPVRYVTMQCVRADSRGEGRSRLLDITGFRSLLEHGDISSQQISLLEQEPVPWQIADYLGGGVSWRTILSDNTLNWRRYSIASALASEDISLSEKMMRTLIQVEQVIEQSSRHHFEFLMVPGDFLIVDNLKCLHARSGISNPDTNRLMYRAWVE